MAVSLVSTKALIKAGTSHMGSFDCITPDATPAQFYNFSAAISSMQDKTLTKVVQTDEYRFV